MWQIRADSDGITDPEVSCLSRPQYKLNQAKIGWLLAFLGNYCYRQSKGHGPGVRVKGANAFVSKRAEGENCLPCADNMATAGTARFCFCFFLKENTYSKCYACIYFNSGVKSDLSES